MLSQRKNEISLRNPTRHVYERKQRKSCSGKQSEEPNKHKLPHHFTLVARENKLYLRFRINNNKQVRVVSSDFTTTVFHITVFYFPWRMGRSLQNKPFVNFEKDTNNTWGKEE